jgi:hypothetical protein
MWAIGEPYLVINHVVVELVDAAAPPTLESLSDALDVWVSIGEHADRPAFVSLLDWLEVDPACRVGTSRVDCTRRTACGVARFRRFALATEMR